MSLIFTLFFAVKSYCISDIDSTQSIFIQSSNIKLNTFVESSEVPVNRPVIFHVELSWMGDLNRYKIEPVSQPILTNLLMEGSGSGNRLDPLDDGKFMAVKSLTYRFKPVEMGMAYIDGVVVSYIDQKTGKEDQLTSQRVMVKIIDPLPDKNGGFIKSIVYSVLLVIFFGTLIFFLILYFKKRRDSRNGAMPVISLPESYLNRLSQEVDPRGTNLNEMTIKLSKIFREYLDQEFKIAAKGSSTKELIEQLQTVDFDETDFNHLKTIFEKLDIIQFAGKNIDPSDFTQIYGGIEAFLIKRKQKSESHEVELKEE